MSKNDIKVAINCVICSTIFAVVLDQILALQNRHPSLFKDTREAEKHMVCADCVKFIVQNQILEYEND